MRLTGQTAAMHRPYPAGRVIGARCIKVHPVLPPPRERAESGVPSGLFFNQFYDIQQHQRADKRDDQGSEHSARRYTETLEHEPADKRPYDSNNDIADETETNHFHDFSGKPSCNCPYHYKQQ
jgi:hypothetical protein